LEEGIFYSELLFEMDGEELRIDSRTSDAVALALRFRCPIYTSEEILAKAGIVFENADENMSGSELNEDEKVRHSKLLLDKKTVSELHEMLDEAIGNEDYEKASVIRDELKKRNRE
jgi:hypothetical protein